MVVKTRPASYFGWPGTRVTYRVEAEGATEVALGAVPAGLDARYDGVADAIGCRGTLTVTVTGSELA